MIKFNKKIKTNGGMTYVELIVVLSIFAVLSSIAIFNYRDFQSHIDIKNLASDITLKIVEAQRSSLSGLLPGEGKIPLNPDTWQPTYGVHFNLATDTQTFIYFVDLDNNSEYNGGLNCKDDECINKISITKNNVISGLAVFYSDGSSGPLNDLTLTFKRPNSSPVMTTSSGFNSAISFVQISVLAPDGKTTSAVKVYSSGRVEIGPSQET